MSIDPSSEQPVIAGFWRRLVAFALDWLLLGMLGVLMGIFLTPQFVELGPWGRLLGFGIALVYFGPLNSRLSGGQTLAKRLLKIKVVALDGTPLSLPRSMLRFVPLGAPWFLNNAQFPESVPFSFWGYLLSIATFGIGLSVVYLYVFNRRSRRSLHDLLVGSYVVAEGAQPGAIEPSAPWRLHYVVCGLLVLVAAVTAHFTIVLSATKPFIALQNLQQAVRVQPWVTHAQVDTGITFDYSAGKTPKESTYLHVIAHSKDGEVENVERAEQLARLALLADASTNPIQVIRITLVHGYDIGIAWFWQSQSYARPREDWRAQ